MSKPDLQSRLWTLLVEVVTTPGEQLGPHEDTRIPLESHLSDFCRTAVLILARGMRTSSFVTPGALTTERKILVLCPTSTSLRTRTPVSSSRSSTSALTTASKGLRKSGPHSVEALLLQQDELLPLPFPQGEASRAVAVDSQRWTIHLCLDRQEIGPSL